MAEYWKYIGTCTLPSDIPPEILNEWKETLKAEQARIYANLQAKVPDEVAFLDRIADASSDEYENFLQATGGRWDADIIKMKQRIKLARAYPSWNAGITAAFGEGGYFASRVDEKADKFKLVRYVLGAVGYRANTSDPYGVWNPVVVGVLLMRGDTRPARYFDANDSFSGTLESVLDPIKGRLISPSIIAHGVYAVVMAKFADEGGLTALRDEILSNANGVIDELLNVALDDVHKGSGYDVTYVLEWDDVTSNVKVTVTDIHP